MRGMQKNNGERLIKIVIFFLVILRFALYNRLPYFVFSDEFFDDGMLHDIAKAIINGHWLGEYDCRTLSKGVSYELFISFFYWTGISYAFALGILNICAAYVFIEAFQPVITNKWIRYGAFLFLIWNPVSFDAFITRRLYRNALIPGMVLLIFGCLIGAYIRRKDSWKKTWFWHVGEGISLAFFYHLREDSIWIMPSVIVVLLSELGFVLYQKKKSLIEKKEMVGKTCCAILPVIVLFIYTQMICACNYYKYGEWITNDRMDTAFADVIDDLYRIKDDQDNSIIWISRDALEQAMEVSPTLASERESIEELYDAWSNDEGEVAGDLAVWSLRQALWNGENYSSAAELEEYCESVHEELQDAFKKGLLEDDEKIHLTSGMEGTNVKELYEIVNKTVYNLYDLSNYDYIGIFIGSSNGDINKTFDTYEILGCVSAVTGYVDYTDNNIYLNNILNRIQSLIEFFKRIAWVGRIAVVLSCIYCLVKLLFGIRKRKWTMELDLF